MVYRIGFFAVLLLAVVKLKAQSNLEQLGIEAYTLLNLPDLSATVKGRPITVAVIDDGFLLRHRSLQRFIWTNEAEIPRNGVDDDGNGYVDDWRGWDVADADNDVNIDAQNREMYYHGTMIASIITRVAELTFGEQAPDRVRIMPIKAVSDFATSYSMAGGYEGVDYARKNGADIICMAWNGGSIDPVQARRLRAATQANILILASAGNVYFASIPPPAGLDMVYCLAAHDSLFRKYDRSNYGAEVDLVATGDRVLAGHSIADNAFFSASGTSAAVALAAGVAAVLKALDSQALPSEVMDALKLTAIPIDRENPRYIARLGAGRIDATAALAFLRNPEDHGNYFLPSRTQGRVYLHYDREIGLEQMSGIGQIRLQARNAHAAPENCRLDIWVADTLFRSLSFREFTDEVFIPGNACRLSLQGCDSGKDYLLDYFAIPVDSTTLYCSGITAVNGQEGQLSDGSGEAPYANNVSCQWVITVEEGRHICLDFKEFHTRPGQDKVLIFLGSNALQENILASFSGDELPPIIVASSNQVLIWFVTDEQETDEGWKLDYSATPDPPGVYARSKN